MFRVFPKLFSLLILLSTFADSCMAFAVSDSVCHDTHNSLVLVPSGDLAIAANDTAITCFASKGFST